MGASSYNQVSTNQAEQFHAGLKKGSVQNAVQGAGQQVMLNRRVPKVSRYLLLIFLGRTAWSYRITIIQK